MNLIKIISFVGVFFIFQISADELSSKPASQATLEYQKSVTNALPFADTRDFTLAEKA
jgi:alkyl sulfatase BDS1-like metallo-beta-lactamase superfamily hydrolase